jgi:UDP-N-acetylmuramoyl-tripeptide--D-alanyl-D-alanine ligase
VDSRPLQFIVEACAGKLISGELAATVLRVNTDSRQAQAGDLFVALAGERFDGHEFVPAVAAQGAVAVLVNRGRTWPALPCAVIEVADTRRALGEIAAAYRRSLALPVIAVGGSNGKTSTKEMLGAVLSQGLKTVWSEASFNNDIGVPHTLLRIGAEHQAAVLELGTNHPGELAPLIRMAQPSLGVITSIGREHLEFFGDLNGVVREEGMLAELLPANGALFLNGDNEFATKLVARTVARAVRVGFNEANDWRVTRIFPSQEGTLFRVTAPRADYSGEYRITLLGRHQVANALFAIAVAAELGLTREHIQTGLAACVPAKMRLQLYELNGVRVLDDSYNANADSMIAALETLAEFPAKGRKLAVLGDMAELGTASDAAHQEVGRRAAELQVGQLFAVGRNAPLMAAAARAAGLNRVMEFPNAEAAAGALRSVLKPGDVLLLKASRSSRIERVAEILRGSESARKN